MASPLSDAVFTSFGSIDLKIFGNPAELYELSQQVSTIYDRLDDVATRVGKTAENMSYFWQGDSYDSFVYVTKQHDDAISVLATFAKDVASVIDAYGGVIERGRSHFADYADKATDEGLTVVSDRFILRPTMLAAVDCFADGSDQELRNKYQKQLDLFQEIRGLVEEWRADFEQWIKEYFGPLLGRIDSLDGVDSLLKHLRDAGLAGYDAAVDAADKRITSDLSHFLNKQKEYEARAKRHKKDGQSGDPRRNARAKNFDEKGHQQAQKDIDAKLSKLKPADFLLKGAKGAGVLGTVAVAAYDIYGGKSPSTVGAGVAGGAAGGAAGAAASTAAGTLVAPGIGTVAGGFLGGLVGSLGGGKGAEWGWEAGASLRTRQAADEWLTGKYQLSPGPGSRSRMSVYSD